MKTVMDEEQLDVFLQSMENVIIGREKEFKLLLVALLTEGHVLFEDLPGTGKTTMVKAFSKGLDCLFSRVQCTPDLLPSDIVGGSIMNPQTNELQLKKGPIFTNVLLVDEINRALPRTQSSLLESMEEQQATIEGETLSLSSPFIVLATQNPVDMEGTFPLPEAQMDRFLMRIQLGYPSIEEETQMLEQVGDHIPYEEISSIFNPDRLKDMQKKCQEVHVHSDMLKYITTLAHQTRNHSLISIGVSPRASKALYKTIKSWAFMNGRDYVIPDDIKEMLLPVWNHRLTLKPEAHMNDTSAEQILTDIMNEVDLPEEQVIRS